jgi:hypothetical protein
MTTEKEQGAGWDSNGFEIYAASDYHYEDAALLAKLWAIPIAEAKQAIGHKITHQIENLLPAEVLALYETHRNENAHPEEAGDAEAMFNAYANSDYQYEDADLLATLWNIPVIEAKQTIGRKITHQIEDLLPAEVQALHKEHLNEGDFHYATAIEERQAVTITGKDYKLQARVLWSDERPASNLSVKVYDKDTFNDDFLGETTTADNGGFELAFNEKDFKGFFDRKPDLYFVITNDKGEKLFNTKAFVVKNADEKTTPITLVLD